MIDFFIFGINFRLSVGFVGVICLILYIDRVGLMLPTVLAIMLHEVGHLTALLAFGQKPKRIEIKVGALTIVGRFILNSKNELIMLTFGSAFNFIFSIVFYFCYRLFQNQYLLNFSLVMFVVGFFNLLPIMGLDGGDILKISLSKFLASGIVNFISYFFSVLTVLLIIALGVYVFLDTKSNPSLVLLGIYLLLGILISKKQKNDCNI